MNYVDLHKRFMDTNVMTLNREQLEHVLETKFHAQEIPLYSIDEIDYLNDEEVNEKDIYKLYTITDRAVLDEIYSSEEKRMMAEDLLKDKIVAVFNDVKYAIHKWQKKEVTYDQLIDEHNRGKRTSIVLESNAENVISNFKVYGFSRYLVDYLVARVGIPEIKFGDLDDRNYQFYLECLKKNKLI
ncbi:hypothetical protein [Shouchella lonarensis]|uniref:Uncharacterized protein n=1 Tax=Shouchella lonarensis TaxID=1464122 RepID=A0A1G6ICY5_9BACI|nr:hypothetical protein [Shouchella lonarensis]SDC04233.1 hypothetical protein SAMN05421737_10517 [Shouchella lonarensis]